jgi:hypothetical protein
MFELITDEWKRNPVAVYGAVTATLSLLIGVLNWWRGRPSLSLDVSPAGAVTEQGLRYDSITAFAYSTGGSPIAIKRFGLVVFDGVDHLLRLKVSRRFQGDGYQLRATDYGLSYVLPGDAIPPYAVKADQPKRLDVHAEAVWPNHDRSFVFFVVWHSHSRLPVVRRVRPVAPWSFSDEASQAEVKLRMVSNLARQFASQDLGRERLRRERGDNGPGDRRGGST